MGHYKYLGSRIMPLWACGIMGCGEGFGSVESLLQHQTADHPPSECRVCGKTLPSGFLAIQHAFDEHTRAEYVRAYDADSDDIRHREQIKELIEDEIDVTAVIESDGAAEETAVPAGD